MTTWFSSLSALPDTPIPPLAWLFIAILVIFTLAVNIAMIALLRAKTPPGKWKRHPEAGGSIGIAQSLAKLGEAMHNPFVKDRNQLDELSQLVRGLENPSAIKDPDQLAESQDAKRKAE